MKEMIAHETRLEGSLELSILWMLGLFDRPAPEEAVAALRGKREQGYLKPVPFLEGGGEDKDAAWMEALKHLRQLGLLVGEGPLDCLPQVRAYFGARLKAQSPEDWRDGHLRLCYYYKELPDKRQPDTLAEMEPLFAAIAHGCQAGLHQKVLNEIYWVRINRKEDFYLTNGLRAFDANLGALSHFFTKPWLQPVEGLSDHWKALVLNWAGSGLWDRGRFREAIGSMEASLEFRDEEDWRECSIAENNLSELHITLGDVAQARDLARRAVTLADGGGYSFWKVGSRTTLADVLHEAGEWDEAREWFREAEEMQRDLQPEYRFLLALQGYRYKSLLLSMGLAEEVVERARQFFPDFPSWYSLLEKSLDLLILGRAVGQRDQDWDQARLHLNQAVTGLRDYPNHLPMGLLARAAALRQAGEIEGAKRDLDEAFEIAERTHMRLCLLDCHLEAHFQTHEPVHLQKARKLMEETGCFRELPE